MASSIINFTPSKSTGSYILGKIEWNSTAVASSNKSTVEASIYVKKGDYSQQLTVPTSGYWEYTITIAGDTYERSEYASVLNDWVFLGSYTVYDIAHTNTGEKTIEISGSVEAPSGTNFASHITQGGASATLDHIPRASVLTSASDAVIGDYCSVKWLPYNRTLYYKLLVEFDSRVSTWKYESDFIYPDTRSEFTYNLQIPYSMADEIPNGTSATAYVVLYTYSADKSTMVGGGSSKTITVTVPDNSETKPIPNMSLSPVSSLPSKFSGTYVQGHSKVDVNLASAGKHGATIVSEAVTIGTKEYAFPYISDVLTQSGNVTVKSTVTDSRGFIGTQEEKIVVVPYSRPSVKVYYCERCNASGVSDPNGGYVHIKANRTYSSVNSLNTAEIRYRYKADGASFSDWVTILSQSSPTNEVTTGVITNGGGEFDRTRSYVFEIAVFDDISSDPAKTSVTLVPETSGSVISFAGSRDSGNYIVGKIEWSASPDTAANASDVTAKMYVRKSESSPTSGIWSYAININGNEIGGTTVVSVASDWVLIATHSVRVLHNDDGTKQITISGSVSAPSGAYYSHATSGSASIILQRIARSSEIASTEGTALGGYASVRWAPASSSLRYKITYALGSWQKTTGIIHPNTTNLYTYREIIPLEVANQLPNSPSGTVSVTLYCYSDANATVSTGSPSTASFAVTVPDNENTKPVPNMSLRIVSNLSSAFDGLCVQGRSKLDADFSNVGKYRATIVSNTLSIGGNSYSDPYLSDYILQTGALTVEGYAVDSRGFVGIDKQTINVIPYSKPSVVVDYCRRCDENGNANTEGTRVHIKATRQYSRVESRNTAEIRYRYRPTSSSTFSDWITILSRDSASDTVTTGPLTNGGQAFSTTASYVFEVAVFDDISEEPTKLSFVLATKEVYMHRSGKRRSMALGGYVTKDNAFEVYRETHLYGGLFVTPIVGAPAGIVLSSPTSDKKFILTVDDNGNLSVSEYVN